MIKKVLSTLLLLLCAPLVWAQDQPAAAGDWQSVFFNSPTVAIPLLTAAAIQHSAQLKALDLEQGMSEQDVKITKKGILSLVAAGANYSYGNLAGVALADPSNPGTFTTYSSGRYSTGIGLTIPLDRVTSQGNLVKRATLNLERSKSIRQERENQIRQQIVQAYQSLLLSRKLLTIRQEASVTAQTSYRLAEKQFRQGQMPLTDFSAASSQLTEIAIAEASARSLYETSFMLLEEIVGTKISTLMTTR